MMTLKQFVGNWRLVEMSAWDADYLDGVVPAGIVIRKNGTGSFQFGCVQGELDCSIDTIGGAQCLGFSWEGSDDAHPVSGRGWLTVSGMELTGKICFHLGDESDLKAVRT